MTAPARARTQDSAQISVWDFIPPAPTDDVRHDLVELMKVMARQRDAFGVTPGEVVARYEETTGRVVGGEHRPTKEEEQRQTSWLGSLGRLAGLKATKDVRPSPVKRHHGHRHTVYVWPSIRDIQR